jgi:hypothetical protein
VVILIRIKKIYIKVLKNQLSVTVVKNISVNGKAILFLVIMLSRNIIVSWFNENITKAEVVTISPLNYTNKGICI